MSTYERLCIPEVINANATLTRLGGSLMPPEVVDAMQAASRSFVDLHQLQAAVGARIAELTGNEAAYVSSGAASGLYLAALACGLSTDPAEGLSLHDVARNEVLIHRSQHNAYLPSIELAGARLALFGDESGASEDELESAISDRSLAVFYFAGSHLDRGSVPLERVVEIARERGLRVVVDAAAQLPPVENLWRFTTELGVDLVVFSGGKGLRGPQSSGLVLGRRELVEVCRAHGAPNQHRGRAMKVGKEEMMGLLAAVERYLALDQEQLAHQYEQMVGRVLAALSELPGVEATRDWPSEAGQPIPRARIVLPRGARDVERALWDGTPRISVAIEGDEVILINPETLNLGEEITVADRLVEAIERLDVNR